MNKRVLLIDGKNLVYRAHYGSMGLKDSQGRPTSVLHEFPLSLFKIQDKYGASDLVVLWDNGHPLMKPKKGPAPVIWRKEIGKGLYKANRKSNPESIKAVGQIPELARMLDICGILQLGVPTLEADDLMGLASQELLQDNRIKQIYLLSNDRDHFQLVQPRVMILYPGRAGIRLMDENEVFLETQIWPHEWAAYKALVGDSSDNFKAIKGIGPKQGVQMIRGGVDPSVSRFSKLPQDVQLRWSHLRPYWEAIHRCYRLSKIPLTIEDPDLPKETHPAVCDALHLLMNRRHRSFSEDGLDKRLRNLIGFLSGYDLDQLISRKRAFFQGCTIT